MDFYERFELLELVKDDGIKTFEAREIATGRPVRVHLFVAPKAPLQAALLKALDQMPEEEAKRILTRGKNEGTPYIVTDRLIDHKSLQDWVLSSVRTGQAGRGDVPPALAGPPLSDSPNTPANPPQNQPHNQPHNQPAEYVQTDLGSAGAWRVPSVSNMAPSASAEKGVAPELLETALMPRRSAEPVQAPPANPVRSSEMSEFTRMFQSPGAAAPVSPGTLETSLGTSSGGVGGPTPPEIRAVPPNAFGPTTPATPSLATPSLATPTPADVKQGGQEPTEFTKMFQTPAAPQPKYPAPAARAPQARSNEPGEFTRMFHSPAASPPSGISNPPAAPAKKTPEPGEFTRMFQQPAAPVPPAPPQGAAPTAAKPAGEFTRMFQRPPDLPAEAAKVESPAPAGSGAAPAGEFTRFFQSPAGPMPQSPAVQQPIAPQASSGSGRVGEFTRMFGQGELPANPSAQPMKEAGGVQGSAISGSATQAFSAQSFQAPPTLDAPADASINPAPVQTGPGEYTRMFTAPAELTLGQTPSPGSAQAGGSRIPMPQVSVSAPQVSAPQVSAPQFSAPQVSAPQFSAPQMSAPQVSAPQVSAPSYSAPQMSMQAPSVPQPSIPQPSFPQQSAAPAGAASKTNMVLIFGLIGVVILAIAVVVIFAMGKR